MGKIDPKTCNHSNGYVVARGGMAENFICSRCGALVNNTPFGKKLLLEDARERWPECKNYDVEKWKQEAKKVESV